MTTSTPSPATADRPHKAAKRYIYAWGDGGAEGNATMRDLLGGKGAGLAEMTKAGLPTPPGFTITTEACNDYFAAGERLPDGLWDDVLAAMRQVEERTGKGFGDAANPLLVSVRSGAKFSMPGMMDTVLNLGLNDKTVKGLIELTGNERFGWDAYRRFIQMFGRIVMGVPGELFDHELELAKKEQGVEADTDLDAAALQKVAVRSQKVYREHTQEFFPQDPNEQLDLAIKAVFASWFGKRARDYRKNQAIADDLGTAVNVVTMVFGNMGEDSGTGSRSRAIPTRARRSSSASTSPTPRARTWWPASGPPRRSRRCRPTCPTCMPSSSASGSSSRSRAERNPRRVPRRLHCRRRHHRLRRCADIGDADQRCARWRERHSLRPCRNRCRDQSPRGDRLWSRHAFKHVRLSRGKWRTERTLTQSSPGFVLARERAHLYLI